MSETFGQGNTPFYTNTERVLEAKILNAIAASSGGSGGAGVVGSGSPEGVVVATPGTVYLDSTGNQLWLKKTGSGATGWVEIVA